jgi:hypothetical protein
MGILEGMSSIRRQLITFAAVLAGLYTAGFVAGQFIEPEGHAEKPPAVHDGMR